MPSLRELQGAFAAAIFDDACAAGLLAWCAGGHPERGLRAYRDSVLANLAGAVRASYPVLERIVGTPFLNAAIDAFVRRQPSISGDLNRYGGEFGDFLGDYAPAAGLPYLPDVARLEWQVQGVCNAPDAPDQDLAVLAKSGPDGWGELRFRLDPAHAVAASRWPVARIWAVNQAGYDGDFAVDFDEAQTVLVHRRPGGTIVERLSDGEAAFLASLSHGETLAAAAGQGLGYTDFELQSALQRFISDGLLRTAYFQEKCHAD